MTCALCVVQVQTAFRLAAARGRTDLTKALLSIDGVDVNAADAKGNTALHETHADTVDLLLAVDGLDLNATNTAGETALVRARKRPFGDPRATTSSPANGYDE